MNEYIDRKVDGHYVHSSGWRLDRLEVWKSPSSVCAKAQALDSSPDCGSKAKYGTKGIDDSAQERATKHVSYVVGM